MLAEGTKIVFLGDSITEEGRFQDHLEGIGYGYVRLIRDYLMIEYPALNLEVLNRGVSGNRITDLAERWKADCLDLEPSIASISIGINDVWRQLDNPEMEQVLPEKFEAIYRELLEQLTCRHIFLMEPTVIEENLVSKGNILLERYVSIVRKLAAEFEAELVPVRRSFIQQFELGQARKLTTDGVHMNSMGDMLMAKTWIQTFKHTFSDNVLKNQLIQGEL